MARKQYRGLGLMSGSSLDGLDLAYCFFEVENNSDQLLSLKKWELIKSETISYSPDWISTLRNTTSTSTQDLLKYHVEFGKYIGDLVNIFMEAGGQLNFISLHGHTVFHFPEEGYSFQLGDGESLHIRTNIPVISRFRDKDIQLGGQGTPLAPIADTYLFGGHDFYLNLGGIANMTIIQDQNIIAYDICVANQLLNKLSNQLGQDYDHNGDVAKEGEIHEKLLHKLNSHEYFSRSLPKSLDNGFSSELFASILDTSDISIQDKLATTVEHIARQIQKAIIKSKNSPISKINDQRVFVTGGGAFNNFLLERVKYYINPIKITLPDTKIINFKEAILMAWMGVLRLEKVPNVLGSVTGSGVNSVSGIIYE